MENLVRQYLNSKYHKYDNDYQLSITTNGNNLYKVEVLDDAGMIKHFPKLTGPDHFLDNLTLSESLAKIPILENIMIRKGIL